MLLEPLPFSQPDRLVTVWLHNPLQGFEKDITSYPNFRDWREQGRSFSHMVGVTGANVTLSAMPGIDAVFLGRAAADDPLVRPVVSVHRSLRAWTGLVPFVRGAHGVLELPVGTIEASGTQVGDLVRLG